MSHPPLPGSEGFDSGLWLGRRSFDFRFRGWRRLDLGSRCHLGRRGWRFFRSRSWRRYWRIRIVVLQYAVVAGVGNIEIAQSVDRRSSRRPQSRATRSGTAEINEGGEEVRLSYHYRGGRAGLTGQRLTEPKGPGCSGDRKCKRSGPCANSRMRLLLLSPMKTSPSPSSVTPTGPHRVELLGELF